MSAEKSSKNAENSQLEINDVINQIKALIEAAGDGTGDCNQAEEFKKIADKHFAETSQTLEIVRNHTQAIDGHVRNATEHQYRIEEAVNNT